MYLPYRLYDGETMQNIFSTDNTITVNGVVYIPIEQYVELFNRLFEVKSEYAKLVACYKKKCDSDDATRH